MRTSIIFPIALLLILGYLINNTQAYKQSGPMLKVIVRTSGTIISGGTTEYYLVYDSGAVRKCPEFTPTLVEAYQVDENNIYDSAFLINTNSWNRLNTDSPLYIVADDIVELVKKSSIKKPDIYKIYLSNGRYFFDIFTESGSFLTSFSNYIFEYLPEEKRIVEITKFKSRNIVHIELLNVSP